MLELSQRPFSFHAYSFRGVLSHQQRNSTWFSMFLLPCRPVRYTSDSLNINVKGVTECINITEKLSPWNVPLRYCILSVIIQSLFVFNFKLVVHVGVKSVMVLTTLTGISASWVASSIHKWENRKAFDKCNTFLSQINRPKILVERFVNYIDFSTWLAFILAIRKK